MFFARPHLLPGEMSDDDYPLLLNTGRLPRQWHTMTKTGKVAKLNKLNPGPFVEIHPDDAARLQIADDDPVEIASRRGRAVLPAVVTDRERPGNCFAPFHWNDVFGEYLSINEVTNDAVDPTSKQPEYKAWAVTLKKVAIAKPAIAQPLAPATDTPVIGSTHIDALAELLGVTDLSVPRFDPLGRSYLSGLVTVLGSEVGRRTARAPVLPVSAPFEPSARMWVDGVLAGLFSRAPLPEALRAAAPGGRGEDVGQAEPERTPITLLWASQAGNAEEFAVECAAQLGAAGLPVAMHAMDEFRLPSPRNTARADGWGEGIRKVLTRLTTQGSCSALGSGGPTLTVLTPNISRPDRLRRGRGWPLTDCGADLQWEGRLTEFARSVAAWTGNDGKIVEQAAKERNSFMRLAGAHRPEPRSVTRRGGNQRHSQ